MADPVKCRSCLTQIPSGANVCPACGPLVRCAKCEALVRHGTEKCPGCQMLLDPIATAPPAHGRMWEDWITRTTAVLAVLAALSSGVWGSTNLKAILEQGKLNDTWAMFQAKSIKQHAAEDSAGLGKALSGGRDASPELAAFVKAMTDESARLTADKDKVSADADALEKSRDSIVGSSFWFQAAFACLQVGVVLCTIASAARKKIVWLVSILVGVFGLVVLANGFVGVVPAPEDSKRKMAATLDANVLKSPTPDPNPKASPGGK